jgi:hypothetical protein
MLHWPLQILQPDLDESAATKQAAVVSSVYDRHKATLGDELGKPRLLGAANRLPPGHVFGKCSAREAEPCVGELRCSQRVQEPSAYSCRVQKRSRDTASTWDTSSTTQVQI